MIPYMNGIMMLNVINPNFVHCMLVGRDCVMQEKDGKQLILAL